jgi:hypothetical protein
VVTGQGVVVAVLAVVEDAAEAVVRASVVTVSGVRAATMTKKAVVMRLDVVIPLPRSPLQAQSPAEPPFLPLPPLSRSQAALQVVTALLQVVMAPLPPATLPLQPPQRCPFPAPLTLPVFAVVTLEVVTA